MDEVILSRRTIHSFKTDVVALDLIKQAIGLALHAPNHRHTQPWQFTLIGQDLRPKIASLAIELNHATANEQLSSAKEKAIKAKFMNPPILIALGQNISDDPKTSREDYASIACGVQNISLFLWEKSIGSKWSTGPVSTHEKLYKWLGIDKAKQELVGFLWIGYPEVVPKRPPKAIVEGRLKFVGVKP